jgi:hypothetical protein
MKDLKKYDRYLDFIKHLDGQKKVIRKSPFNSRREFDILVIKNQYPGSFKWIIKEITLMDTQRFNIIGKSIRNNLAIRAKKSDDRMSREIADFIHSGGQSIII